MASPTDNVYQDLDTLTHGTDWVWRFSITPLDLTGASAQIQVTGIGTFAFTLSVATLGQSPISYFALHVPAATTNAWAPGLYDYRVLVTFADGTVLPYGYGKFPVV